METIRAYIKSIEHIPRISVDEEKRLSKIIHNSHDKDEIDKTVNKLVIANLRLVISRAQKFRQRFPYLNLMNLISDGNLSLLRAAQRYKPDHDAVFCSYAVSCIDKCFYRTMSENDIIKIPKNQNDKIIKLNKKQAKTIKRLDDTATMELLDIGEDSLERLKNAKNVQFVKSLDENIGFSGDEDSVSLISILPDKNAVDVEQEAHISTLRDYLEDKMRRLTDNEKLILHLVYLDGNRVTYNELSDKMGLSSERCRQILVRARIKLRKFIGSDPTK